MINVQELKIGNWVFDELGVPYMLNEGNFLQMLKWYMNENYYPIPLTPEVLEKCGFKKDEDAGNWHSPEHTIYSAKGMSVGIKDGYIGWYNQCDDDFYSSFYPELNSLHQLMNLHFALTGQELNYTP